MFKCNLMVYNQFIACKVVCAMNNLIASVDLNSSDVEEGQLPDDGYQQQASPNHNNLIEFSDHDRDSSSGEIVLEVVEDQSYKDRNPKRISKPVTDNKKYQPSIKEKDKNYSQRLEKERKIQKNDKKAVVSFAPEKEELNSTQNNIKNTGYPPPPYYPPYMYPPHPIHLPMNQYPPMYPPYSYPMPYLHPNQSQYNGNMVQMPPPYPINGNSQPGQNSIQAGNGHNQYNQPNQPNQYNHQNQHGQPNQYSQPNPYNQYKLPYMPPANQYPEYMMERPNQNNYKMPPPPINMYGYPPGYPGYPMPYPPYDFYERQREAQLREEQAKASRKKEYIDQLRSQLRRNVKEFNSEQTYEIVEAVKCILKFQESKSTNSQSPYSNNTQAPSNPNEVIKESISQRVFQRSLQKVERWLEGDNANVREFMKGLLQAMQMGEIILKIKQLKLNRKMQQENLQSETKRLLDVLVRDPKKMIF